MKNITIIPLGGIEEIGKNSTIFEYQEEIILVDYGIKFEKEKILGNIIYYPEPSYLEKNLHKLKGIFITHGHLDHYGSLLYLVKIIRKNNIPIFALDFTIDLIKHFFKKNNLQYDLVYPIHKNIKFNHFEIEPIQLEHSVVDSIGYLIKTEVGNIFITGDFKSINKKTLTELSSKDITLLMSDSTNANKDKKKVELKEIYNNLDLLIKENKRIFLSHFSSQVSIIKMVLEIAFKSNRYVIPLGKSIEDIIGILKDNQELKPYINIIASSKEAQHYPEAKIIFLATGSQGEKNSSLWKLAHKKMPNINLNDKDTLILSSSVIPGNEIYLNEIINNFYKQGAKVITNSDINIHASGHAYKNTLGKVISLIKPKYFIPVHGEMKHLIHHKDIALSQGMLEENVFIIENGAIIILNKTRCLIKNKLKIKDKIILNNNFISEEFVEEKKNLAEKGMITFNFFKTSENGSLKLKINSLGIVPSDKKNELHKNLEKVIYREDDLNNKSESGIKKKILKSINNVFNYNHLVKPKFITFNFLY